MVLWRSSRRAYFEQHEALTGVERANFTGDDAQTGAEITVRTVLPERAASTWLPVAGTSSEHLDVVATRSTVAPVTTVAAVASRPTAEGELVCFHERHDAQEVRRQHPPHRQPRQIRHGTIAGRDDIGLADHRPCVCLEAHLAGSRIVAAVFHLDMRAVWRQGVPVVEMQSRFSRRPTANFYRRGRSP